jgi:hypothetical protein
MNPFGIHWAGAVAWLVQADGGENFVGLKNTCPVKGSGLCNHKIPTKVAPVSPEEEELWSQFLEDPLVQVMLPLPREEEDRAFFLNDAEDKLTPLLRQLSRLSSPIRNCIQPFWLLNKKDFPRQLDASNIQPFIGVQATQKSQATLENLIGVSFNAPRTVIVTGDPNLVVRDPLTRIETSLTSDAIETLEQLPLEQIGAIIVRKHARRED